MEIYKLGNTIHNQKNEIHLALHQLNEAREELKLSLKTRKEIDIEENDTHYKEEDTSELFIDGNSSEFNVVIAGLMKKNGALTQEVKNLKMEQGVQLVLLCEVSEQKKKVEEDKVMIEDDKKILTNRLEEKILEVQRIYSMKLDTMNQLMIENHELNGKDIEIKTLKLQNEQLRNELKREKEFIESFNKPSKAIKYFEKLMRSPRSNDDSTGLGYTSTEEVESSKSGE